MTKRTVLKAILAALQAEMQAHVRAANSARAEATDEQSRAENKYDTRGLEASYLAAGQARQVADLKAAIATFGSLPARKFAPDEAIGLGAIVEMEQGKERAYYFLGPCAGGTEAVCGRQSVLVITPQSPLGRQLQGRKEGEWLEVDFAGARRRMRVVSVR